MNFIVSSTELLHGLLSGLKVITRTTTPILDNFLFELRGNTLEITASDSETVLKTSLEVETTKEEGSIAVPAKILTDSLKEFPEVPIELKTLDDNTLEISWASGEQKIPFFSAEMYPTMPEIAEGTKTVTIPASIISDAIGYTIYATADEPLRPVMNGILFDLSEESASIVASDSHKLVCFTRNDIKSAEKSSFILPKKPASILRSMLAKADGDIVLSFDGKNARFQTEDFTLIGRLVDGTYPAYRTVIPRNNPNKLLISRSMLLNAAKRVSVCSNPASSSIKFSISYNSLVVSAQDTSFSISAHETILCQYDGAPMDIGFKSVFLIELLSNMPYEELCFEFADPTRAALIIPAEEESQEENICAILMPIRIAN